MLPIALADPLRRKAYPALCEGFAVIGRPLLLSIAEDVTSQTATRSCVVLAPHPDDETLGCGATITRKLVAGTPVMVVIATMAGIRTLRASCRLRRAYTF